MKEIFLILALTLYEPFVRIFETIKNEHFSLSALKFFDSPQNLKAKDEFKK